MKSSRLQPVITSDAYDPGALLDHVMSKLGLKNDAALAVKLGVPAPVICKTRKRVLAVGPAMMIRIHDAAQMTINEIRAFLGMEAK